MAEYKGIIAGIGDKQNNVNVIDPQFDAKIRKFIIGQNCILEGLELNGDTISAGSCIAEGYVGYLPEQKTLEFPNGYVYGRFKVNQDSLILDEFDIINSNVEILIQDDILHNAGEYYLLLYQEGKKVIDAKYPLNAVNSENTDHINDNGTIGSMVTCPTPPVNDNSKKIANTEYVHNQIAEELKIGTAEVDIMYSYVTANFPVAKIELKRKANWVIALSTYIHNQPINADYVQYTSFTIPEEFRPAAGNNDDNNYVLAPVILQSTTYPNGTQVVFSASLVVYKVTTDGISNYIGTVSIAESRGSISQDINALVAKNYVSGWEMN